MSYPDYELPYAKKVLNKERVSSIKMSLLKAGKTIVNQAYLPFPLSPAHSFSPSLSAGNLLTMPILVEYTKWFRSVSLSLNVFLLLLIDSQNFGAKLARLTSIWFVINGRQAKQSRGRSETKTKKNTKKYKKQATK